MLLLLIYEIEYNNGELNGRYISWYQSGVIKEQGTYNKNSKVGNWISYDSISF